MFTRKIAFPDHTADDFDPDQVFEAFTGLKYTWNGYGWELVDGGIEKYDDQWIKDDQDRQDNDLSDFKDEVRVDQERQDKELSDFKNEISLEQESQDKALADYKEEVSLDQDRQDDELEAYKGEVAIDQQRQDKELSDYKVKIAEEQAAQDKALKDEIDARAERDLLHDAQINTIEYKLDALVGIQFKGIYTFEHDADCDAAYLACLEAAAGDPIAATACGRDQLDCENGKVTSGTFEAVDPDGQFDHLEAIVIHKNSKDGEELEWDSILKAGDYLEIDHNGTDGLDKQNYGLYRVTADVEETVNANGEPVYDIQLEFLQGAGDLVDGEDYECRGISAAEGVNPEELGDFLTKDEAANTYALITHDHDDLTTTVTVDSGTVTGAEGTNAAVVNTGTTKDAKFKFTIPRGYKGQKGQKGAAGADGTKGSTGSNGSDMVMQTGTSTNPSLNRGKMYLNYNQKVLYIGC